MYKGFRNKVLTGGVYKMENLLGKTIESKRNYLINKLINAGIYKKKDSHLFELTLTDLEEEYKKMIKQGNI